MTPVASDRLQLAHFTADGLAQIDGLESEIQAWLRGVEVVVVKIDTAMCTDHDDAQLSVLIWYEATPLQPQQPDDELSFT